MKDKKYWTKEKCFEEVIKYKTKKDFIKNAPGAFTALRRNNWISEIWGFFTNQITNSSLRCVYAYEFEDNSVYVGITYDLPTRHRRHENDHRSAVYKHMKNLNVSPILKQLTQYIEASRALNIEIETIKNYRTSGWNVLNRTTGGESGAGRLIWTKEKCLMISKQCKTKNEFVKKHHGAWNSSKKNGWLDEIRAYFPEIIKPKGYWTREKCINAAISYTKKEDFRKGSPSAYTISIKNGWFDEATSHMR